MSEFNEEEINKLAELCRIECSEEEKKSLSNSLERILDYIKQLNEVDTEGVEPCNFVIERTENVLREDEVGETLSREIYLSNAPDQVGGMIRVPPIIKFST